MSDIMNRMSKSLDRNRDISVKGNDLDILQVLLKKGRLKQYSLERELKKQHKGIAHSTVTGKMRTLENKTLIHTTTEHDGHTYYELTPIGLATLVGYSRIDLADCLSFLRDNPRQTFEALAAFQPKLTEQLEKQPLWFPIQLTSELWAIYYMANRSELRRQTTDLVLTGKFPTDFDVRIEFYCANRIYVEEKAICLKERKACLYNESTCPIIKEQLDRELQKLSK